MDIRVLKDHAKRVACEYTVVSFPLVYAPELGVGFTTKNLPIFPMGFSNDGLTYLLYRLGAYVNRDKARELYSTDLGAFVCYINGCRSWQETENFKLGGKDLILVTSRGTVEGLLTNYNVVPHLSVLDRIEQSPIKDNITGYSICPKRMVIKFRSKYILDNKAAFGLAVCNGETGHVALSYNFFVESGSFTFLFPLKDRRRHLSKVGEVNQRLVDVFEAANEVDLDAKLRAASPLEIPANIIAGFDKIAFVFEKNTTLRGVVDDLLRFRTRHGYKGQATKALEYILNRKLGEQE